MSNMFVQCSDEHVLSEILSEALMRLNSSDLCGSEKVQFIQITQATYFLRYLARSITIAGKTNELGYVAHMCVVSKG